MHQLIVHASLWRYGSITKSSRRSSEDAYSLRKPQDDRTRTLEPLLLCPFDRERPRHQLGLLLYVVQLKQVGPEENDQPDVLHEGDLRLGREWARTTVCCRGRWYLYVSIPSATSAGGIVGRFTRLTVGGLVGSTGLSSTHFRRKLLVRPCGAPGGRTLNQRIKSPLLCH